MLIAGPCGIESRDQAFKIASFVKSYGATIFRAGAYKGQNRPYINGKAEYLGMGDEGVKILSEIQKEVGIPVACDMQSVRQAEVLYKYDIQYPQVGARNADSLELLRQFKKIFPHKTIILKRAPHQTVDEWLGAAEHLGGEDHVILCERGTIHFDRHHYTRYRLDFVGVAEIKKFTNYRVIIDPSHGSGNRDLVPLLSKAALNIADGLMVEVHYDPDSSPTDAPQTIDFEEFKKIGGYYERFLQGKV